MNALTLTDQSHLPRAGVKGPGAAAWLKNLGLLVPESGNCWQPLSSGLIARLGQSEYLVEGPQAAALDTTLAPGVYPVLRQDTALYLRGGQLNALLLETCSVDCLALDPLTRPVLLTSMAGVTVTLIPELHQDIPGCYLWCDHTYGTWLSDTLAEVIHALSLSDPR